MPTGSTSDLFSGGAFGSGDTSSLFGDTTPLPISRARRRKRRQQAAITPALQALSTIRNLGIELAGVGYKSKYKSQRQRLIDILPGGDKDSQFTESEFEKRKKAMQMTRSQYAGFLSKNYGIDSSEAEIYADSLLGIGKGRRGLVASTILSPLELAGDILSVPGNIAFNTFLGARHGWQGVDENDPWGWAQLWESTKGLSEGVTKSPWRSNSISKYWSEVAADPEAPSFLGNRFVQFGLTMATDPVMYLSFGATPMTKSLGMQVLAESNRRAVYHADRIMNASSKRSHFIRDSGLEWHGPGKVTLPGSDKLLDTGDIAILLRQSWGDPMDLLDSMRQIRTAGLARKQRELRSPVSEFRGRRAGERKRATLSKKYEPGEMVEQSVPGAVGGTLIRMMSGAIAPRNIPGGAGIRFAGREVPGTAKAGHDIATWMRTKLSENAVGKGLDLGEFGLGSEKTLSSSGLVTRLLGKGFMPRWELKLIADDTERAVASAKWDKMRWAQSELQPNIGRRMLGLGAIGKEGELIPVEHRANLLRGRNPGGDDNLSKLWTNIHNVKTSASHRAMQAGIGERELAGLWTELIRKHSDPLATVAEFSWRAEARALKHEFITDMLEDPQFSKMWVRAKEGGELPSMAERSITRHYGETIPHGYSPFKYKGKNYVVKRSVVEPLSNLANAKFLDNELNAFIGKLQTPQNFWKTFATVPNPSFHVMNFLGAVWNNMGAGVYNPADYIESLAILWNARLASYAQQGKRALHAGGYKVPEVTPLRGHALALHQSMASRGGLGRESIFQELVAGTHARLPGELTTGRRVQELYRKHPDESTKRYAFRQARRGTAIGAAATGNIPAAAMLMMPEIAGVGRAVGTTVEDAVRIAPFLKAGKQHDAWAVLDALGPPRVPGNMNKNWTRADQEAMSDIGARISTKFQFDYGDMQWFERNIAKSIFPFWTFYKNNFLLQAGWIANRPRHIYAAQAMENFISDQADPLGPMEQILPAYFDNLDAFQIPLPESLRRKLGISLTDPVFLNPKLPFVSLNMMPAFWNVFNEQATTPERMAAVIAPFMGQVGAWAPVPVPGAKMLFEAYTNYNFGLNQRLDYTRANSNDASQAWVPAPKWVEFIPEPVRDWLGAVPVAKDLPGYPFGEKNLQYNKASKRWEMLATNAYVAEQLATPFINNLGRSAMWNEPGHAGDKGIADAVSWLSGIRLMPLDIPRIHKSLIYDQISMIEGYQDQLKVRGERLPTQDELTLHYLRKYARLLNKIEDIRDSEVNG